MKRRSNTKATKIHERHENEINLHQRRASIDHLARDGGLGDPRRGFTRSLAQCKGLHTAGELEGTNPGAPIEGTGGFQVFVGVPERAIINGVEFEVAVIAPS